MPEFWTDDHTREVNRIRRYRDLFRGEHEIVLHTAEGGWKLPLYVCLNWLGDRLTKTYSALVWRRFPRLSTPGDDPSTESDAERALKRMIVDTQFSRVKLAAQYVVSYAGYASLKLTWRDRARRPEIIRWGAHPGESANWELDGSFLFAVTFYREEVLPEWHGQKNVIVKIGERFELVDGAAGGRQVVVTNRAYVRTADGAVDMKKPVTMMEISPDYPLPDEDILAMDVLPGCRIANVDDDQEGTSDYTSSLISLQKAQAGLATQRYLAVRINEMPITSIPASALNPDGTVNLASLMVSVRMPGEDATDTIPINMNNWTGALEASASQWDLNDQEFYNLSGLSPAIDGKASAGGSGESGYARRLGLTKTAANVDTRRACWDQFWPWMGRAVPQLALAQDPPVVDYGDPLEDVTATWPDAIPEDLGEIATRTTTRYQAGGMSLEQYVAQNEPDLSPDQVAEEVGRIKGDRLARQGDSLTNFSAFPPM
jgi:hypothetical protein